jgi:hypothetical protein
MPDDNAQQYEWPGSVEEYRNASADAASAWPDASPDAKLIAATIQAGFAGLAQVLDKIAYAARNAPKGGRS